MDGPMDATMDVWTMNGVADGHCMDGLMNKCMGWWIMIGFNDETMIGWIDETGLRNNEEMDLWTINAWIDEQYE